MDLLSPISEIKGFGPKKTEAFSRLGIFSLKDLLSFYPRDYEDLRNIKTIDQLQDEEKAVVEATVILNSLGRGYGRNRNLHLSVMDKTGKMDVIFFMAGFMGKQFKNGDKYCFYGKVKKDNGRSVMFHPSYFPAGEQSDAGILPVYPLTKGLTQKDLRKAVKQALDCLDEYEDVFPPEVIGSAKLCPIDFALKNIHYPDDTDSYQAARYRLIFEELFKLKIALKLSADRFGQGRRGISFSNAGFSDFISSLSYNLTSAQTRVLEEIESDMNSDRAMSRLVQGDVGSGKTVIAEAALYKTVKAGYQGAFMAPTEILAAQHFESFKHDFKNFGLNIEYLSGSLSAKERKIVLQKLENGDCDIVIGTHAIISQSVKFNNLGLAITDEQHRFGVNQRKHIGEKGNNPDVLVMTATPIPRTLAVVLYSDLDISIIDELPPGRKAIITKKFNQSDRKEAYRLLIDEVRSGRQAYIVAPFIEDSESISAYSAESLYEAFLNKYPDINAGLLHGSMPQKDKDEVMNDFAKGNIQVLISTVVIEVGINVANASVMLIENSERFGLAQLHQLRGRVGRGNQQSYCLLVLGDESPIAVQRADIMCSTSDGFVISEKDLELRGPGELFGYRQHGLPQLQLADPVKHASVVKTANDMADKLLSSDPSLERDEHIKFKSLVEAEFGNRDSLVL